MATVHEETPEDFDAVRHVNLVAFGGVTEAWLVDRLREDGLALVSLAAEAGGRVVGHILFSRVAIETPDGPIPAAALAPMAVLPGFQRQGIGSELIRAGLEACRKLGEKIVVVVGHPDYYPRFGFSAVLARRLHSPYCGDAFMALELVSGSAGRGVRNPAVPGSFPRVRVRVRLKPRAG